MASIPLRAVCTGAVHADVWDANRARLSAEEVQDPVPMAKLHVASGEDVRIIAHLAKIGLTAPVEDHEVWQHRGPPLLSGLFGVENRGEEISEAGRGSGSG